MLQAVSSPLELPSPAAAARLGAAIAGRLRRGETVCLWGPLGAGKSTLARGLVRALTTPDEEVPSPTFTLVQTYQGRDFPVAHFDLYRLRSAQEAYELGVDEALAVGAAVIEWPERLERNLPPDRLDVRLEIASRPSPASGADAADAPRLARFSGHGAWIGRVDDLLRSPFA